jgi:hypothetical protein
MVIRISRLTDIPSVKNCQATSIPFEYTVKDFWIMHVFCCHVTRDLRIVKFPADNNIPFYDTLYRSEHVILVHIATFITGDSRTKQQYKLPAEFTCFYITPTYLHRSWLYTAKFPLALQFTHKHTAHKIAELQTNLYYFLTDSTTLSSDCRCPITSHQQTMTPICDSLLLQVKKKKKKKNRY